MYCTNCGCNPISIDRGRLINRRAFLGSQIVSLTDAIKQMEKQARKTPPKHLKQEWEKVHQAKKNLLAAQANIATMKAEYDNISV